MRLTKPVINAAALTLVGLATASASIAASAAPAEPAKAYGGCVSKSSGYLRVLERNALAKSVNGKCKSTERKITWYSRTGIPKPSTLVFKRGTGTETCTRDASSTTTVWSFSCSVTSPTPTASPSPSISPTVTLPPTPTPSPTAT
jgi:hypothetical protein